MATFVRGAVVTVLLCGLPMAAMAQPAPAGGSAVRVQPGETWQQLRNRVFPLEALQRANPNLDPGMLHPGEAVQVPYVPISELARERAARDGLRRQLSGAEARAADLEKKAAALEARQAQVDQAERSAATRRVTIILLVLLVIGLVAALGFAGVYVLAARHTAADVAARDRALQLRYEELRRSLHDIDVKVQGKVVSLLRLHGGKVVTDAEVAASVDSVVDFTDALKKRHEAA